MKKLNSNVAFGILFFSLLTLIVVAQGVTQYWFGIQKNFSKITNSGGEQRMLSQRLDANVFKYKFEKDPTAKQKVFEIFEAWKTAHNNFITGNDSKNSGKIPKQYIARIEALTPHLTFAKKSIDQLDSLDKNALLAFHNNQNAFLGKMEVIVHEFEAEIRNSGSKGLYYRGLIALLALLMISLQYYYLLRPISEKINKQNELLEDKNRLLEYKNEQLEHFAYHASHDLKEPLRTVRSFIGVLKEDYGEILDKEANNYFNFIEDAAGRMSRLIEGLLEYSRLGKMGNFGKIDLNELMPQILSNLNDSIQKKNASIKMDKLPVISCSKTELGLVFQNLISNALKFSPTDRQPEIRISVEDKDEHYQFRIKDNGIGIPEAQRLDIFKIFQKLHRPDEYEGQGLGLAFCKKIVELHGGQIRVESTEGEGSSFFFTVSKKLDHETKIK